MHTTRRVGQRHYVLSLKRRSGLVLSRSPWHLADVCNELSGFFGIALISSMEIYQVKRATCIRIDAAMRGSFSVHSPRDVQFCSVIPQTYRGIKLRSYVALDLEANLFPHSLRS